MTWNLHEPTHLIRCHSLWYLPLRQWMTQERSQDSSIATMAIDSQSMLAVNQTADGAEVLAALEHFSRQIPCWMVLATAKCLIETRVLYMDHGLEREWIHGVLTAYHWIPGSKCQCKMHANAQAFCLQGLAMTFRCHSNHLVL